MADTALNCGAGEYENVGDVAMLQVAAKRLRQPSGGASAWSPSRVREDQRYLGRGRTLPSFRTASIRRQNSTQRLRLSLSVLALLERSIGFPNRDGIEWFIYGWLARGETRDIDGASYGALIEREENTDVFPGILVT